MLSPLLNELLPPSRCGSSASWGVENSASLLLFPTATPTLIRVPLEGGGGSQSKTPKEHSSVDRFPCEVLKDMCPPARPPLFEVLKSRPPELVSEQLRRSSALKAPLKTSSLLSLSCAKSSSSSSSLRSRSSMLSSLGVSCRSILLMVGRSDEDVRYRFVLPAMPTRWDEV